MYEEPEERRNDIDWLRIIATYLLFVFHGAMVFNPAPFFHIRNQETSMVMLVVAGFISLWHMPLFFLLAGWSAHGSLRARGVGSFVRERWHRLAVPLVAGCVLLGPLMKYAELSSGLDLSPSGLKVRADLQDSFRSVIPSGLETAPPFEETFFEFLPTFFTQLERFTWGHLWFVAYLLTFTLVYLPLLAWLVRSGRGPASVARGWVYAPLVPLVLVQVFLRPHWPGIQNLYDDWANVAYYTTFLLAGFTMSRVPAFERAVHAEAGRALILALGATVLLLGAVLELFDSVPVVLACSALAGWGFVVAILGFGSRHLRTPTRGLEYLRESALPVYILHQPALILLGLFVIQTRLGVAAKFATLVVLAVAATMTFYHLAVRTNRPMRLLHGMKGGTARAGLAVRPAAACALAAGLLVSSASHDAACVYAATGHSGSTESASASDISGTDSATREEASSADIYGRWWAEGGAAQVEISPCEQESVCGTIVWLRSPWDEQGCAMLDRHNPEASLRGRPLEGLEVLSGLRAEGAASWIGGRVYDPGSGSTYRCSARLDGDRLSLRGFIGLPIFGRTTTWLRVRRPGGPVCARVSR